MIIYTPEQSRLLRVGLTHEQVSKIKLGVARYQVTDWSSIRRNQEKRIRPISGPSHTLTPIVLYGITANEEDIPGFKHPMCDLENRWIAADARSLCTPNKSELTATIRNPAEMDMLLQRLILNGLWMTGRSDELYSFKFAHRVFAHWITDTLTKKLHLDLRDQLIVRCCSYIYYANLFTDNFNVGGNDDIEKLMYRVKDDYIVDTFLQEVYDKTKGYYQSLEDFGKALHIATDNVKLSGLTTPAFIQMMDNCWTGVNGRELALFALEHPPTWMTLVFASLTLKNFSRNYIATIVDKANKRGVGDEFLRNYILLTRDFLET